MITGYTAGRLTQGRSWPAQQTQDQMAPSLNQEVGQRGLCIQGTGHRVPWPIAAVFLEVPSDPYFWPSCFWFIGKYSRPHMPTRQQGLTCQHASPPMPARLLSDPLPFRSSELDTKPSEREEHSVMFFFFFNIGSLYVTQASLKLIILLSQSPTSGDYRCMPPHLALKRCQEETPLEGSWVSHL